MRVTDEMVAAYVEAVNAHLASLTPRQWEIERFDPQASVSRVARIGLEAALSHAAGQEGEQCRAASGGVTDEMVTAYVEAVNAHLASLTPKQWEVERFDPQAAIARVARIGLTAALRALSRGVPEGMVARECPHRFRCDCLGACKYGLAGNGAESQDAAAIAAQRQGE